MTAHDASRILEIPADSPPERIEARFQELRARLEDKIAKAPTAGLKEKYRATLNEVTTAFETLILAADASSLPVAWALDAASTPPPAPMPAPRVAPAVTPNPVPPAPRKAAKGNSGNREFVFIAVLAVLLLGAGGWWVMNQRAENERRRRAEIAAAEEAKVLEQVEKKRREDAVAAAAAAAALERERQDAERTRVDAELARLRSELAEVRIEWEAWEKEERRAEREVSELKGELRSAKDAFQSNRLQVRLQIATNYQEWLTGTLERHPARIARAKCEELLSARMPEAAETQLNGMRAALAELRDQANIQRAAVNRVEGSLVVQTEPSGLRFTLVDAFGRSHQGTAPATLENLPPGPATVTVERPQYQPVSRSTAVATGSKRTVTIPLKTPDHSIATEADIEIWNNNRMMAKGVFTMVDQAPGTYDFELRGRRQPPYRMKFTVAQGPQPRVERINFTELAAQVLPCYDCDQRGLVSTDRDCSACGGNGSTRCGWCNGRGNLGVVNNVVIRCTNCGGDGRLTCKGCERGTITQTNRCAKCGGDGRLSKLDTQ